MKMTERTTQPKRSKGVLIWLIVSQLAALGSLVIWAFVAGMSVMAFDSGQSPAAWTLVLTIWAYPIFPLVMVIGAWIAYARRANRLAAILSGLAFAPPILLYLFLWIASLIGLP